MYMCGWTENEERILVPHVKHVHSKEGYVRHLPLNEISLPLRLFIIYINGMTGVAAIHKACT